MPGRKLWSAEAEAAIGASMHPVMAKRRAVLRETIERFRRAQPPYFFRAQASANLVRWRDNLQKSESPEKVRVIKGDWGEVTHLLTKEFGQCFAVLNMANAYVPGGAYVEGASAQEENLFRRTDCHFYIGPDEYDANSDRYYQEMTDLLSAKNGLVYLDTKQPRICIRRAEDLSREDLGYCWLPDDEVFPFFELRAAAQDLRDGTIFSEPEARRRIAAQLDTLVGNGVRHVVLGASGCGAFRNPADQIAQCYRSEIEERKRHFQMIAFAIFGGGEATTTHSQFEEVFRRPMLLGLCC